MRWVWLNRVKARVYHAHSAAIALPRSRSSLWIELTRDDAVLPGVLGRVGRGIRALDRLLGRFLGTGGNHTRAESHRTVCSGDRLRSKLTQKALHHGSSGLQRGIGKHQDKLFAAKATQHVARTHRLVQHRDQASQRLIANLMTKGIVQPLEIIEIDMYQRKRRAVSTSTGKLAQTRLVETSAIQCPRQRIGARRFARFSQRCFQLCDAHFSREKFEHSGFADDRLRQTDHR